MPDPVLHTERLTLRPLTAHLAASLLTAAPNGFPTDDDQQVLRAVLASGDEAHGSFVLEHDNLPIGTLGVAGGPSPQGDQELGYGLVPSARGQGLATEGVAALCAYLEQAAGVRRLIAEVLPGSQASVRLLLRLGFAEVDGGTGQHQLMARAAPGEPPVPKRIVGRHVC